MRLTTICLTAALCCLTAATAVEVHVATAGNDAGPGTAERPYATLARARQAARDLRAQTGGQVTVVLRGGTYQMTEPLLLEAADSGTAEAPAVWQAAPGEVVRLFGGTMLQRDWFTPVTDPALLARVISVEARGQLLQCDLRAHGITDYGALSRRGFHKANLGRTPPAELFIDGERMRLARWPNPDDHFPDYLRGVQKHRHGVVGRSAIVDPGPGMNDPDFLERGGVIAYEFDRPALWAQADDIWLDGVFTWSWEWSYNQVAGIDHAKRELTLRYGEVGTIADRYSFDYFFAENLLEEIDQPGEYYLDRMAGVLYLLPPASFATAAPSLMLSRLTTPMIRVEGASHLVLRDLLLDCGRGPGITVFGGAGVLVDRCEIRNLSGSGVTLNGQGHGVRATHIHQVGGAGVSLSGGDLATLAPNGCFVEDSVIEHFAWHHRVYTPAISFGYRSVGGRASHNRVRHGPHVAVIVYGNDHLLEGNDIGYVVEEFTDMGAVYANLGSRPLERGTVIRRNYFHHIGQEHHLQNGVYPDNMTMGWRIEENVFHRIGGRGEAANSRAINLNSAAHVVTRHNLFIDCTIPMMMSRHAGGSNFERTLEGWQQQFAELDLATMPHAQRYPELLRFFDEPRQFPESCVFERNVIYNPTANLLAFYGRGRLPMREGALDEPGTLQVRDNWVAETDPGFVDAAGGNFALRADAPVFAQIPGFPAIPFETFGPRVPVGPHAGAGAD